jgi:hypothetical protein
LETSETGVARFAYCVQNQAKKQTSGKWIVLENGRLKKLLFFNLAISHSHGRVGGLILGAVLGEVYVTGYFA